MALFNPSLCPASASQPNMTDWRCGLCRALNPTNTSKCNCCETPKPGSSPAASTSLSQPSLSQPRPSAANPFAALSQDALDAPPVMFGFSSTPPPPGAGTGTGAQQGEEQWEGNEGED
eukprot:Selendium_serpulae@DN5626_c1_g2_i11.p1